MSPQIIDELLGTIIVLVFIICATIVILKKG